MSFYDVRESYLTDLRSFLLNEPKLNLTEDPQLYAQHYDPTVLQGFLVWNVSAYLAKEYEFADVQQVDHFVIPVFGGRKDKSYCEYERYFAINCDMHTAWAQTGQRLEMIMSLIDEWHRTQALTGYYPQTLPSGETYVVVRNGLSEPRPLTGQPYIRGVLRYTIKVLRSAHQS